MNELDFRRLCSTAGTYLELLKPDSFSDGERVDIAGVQAEIHLDDPMLCRATLVLELGTIKPQCKIEAYEALLAIQGLLHVTHDCVFDYDGLDDKVLFKASLPLSEDTAAPDLASAINIFVLQVIDWRETLLLGCIEGSESSITKSALAAARLAPPSLA